MEKIQIISTHINSCEASAVSIARDCGLKVSGRTFTGFPNSPKVLEGFEVIKSLSELERDAHGNRDDMNAVVEKAVLDNVNDADGMLLLRFHNTNSSTANRFVDELIYYAISGSLDESFKILQTPEPFKPCFVVSRSLEMNLDKNAREREIEEARIFVQKNNIKKLFVSGTTLGGFGPLWSIPNSRIRNFMRDLFFALKKDEPSSSSVTPFQFTDLLDDGDDPFECCDLGTVMARRPPPDRFQRIRRNLSTQFKEIEVIQEDDSQLPIKEENTLLPIDLHVSRQLPLTGTHDPHAGDAKYNPFKKTRR